MAVNPSPQRQSVVTFPTPNVSDILFFETVDAERIGTDVPEYGTKHPDHSKWPDHRLVYVEAADDQNRYYRYYYAADQIEQDDDNWSFSQADIGGTKFDAVTRDYVIRRSEFDPETPAMGSVMPNVPEDKFDGTYVLAERRQTPINDKTINSLYVIEQRTYVKKTSSTTIGVDDVNGKPLFSKSTLFYGNEVITGTTTASSLFADVDNEYWGVQPSGIKREGRQLSSSWYEVTVTSIIGGQTEDSTDGPILLESYGTSVNYTWPAVLATIQIDEWIKRDGTETRITSPVFDKERYSGPCSAVITRHWRKTPLGLSSLLVDEPPQPLPINITTPYFSVNIPPTLHVGDTLSFTNGSDDPVYTATVASFPIAATNFTDWQSFVISHEQKPFRGGYLDEMVTVYPPTTN